MDITSDHRKGLENRLVLNASEVQQILGLSRGSVYQALASGQIPSIRVGRRILIPYRSLERFLNQAWDEAGGAQQEQRGL